MSPPWTKVSILRTPKNKFSGEKNIRGEGQTLKEPEEEAKLLISRCADEVIHQACQSSVTPAPSEFCSALRAIWNSDAEPRVALVFSQDLI